MGRKALIIIFIILITFISSSVKACNFDYTYYYCTGTCQAGYTCKNTAPETCTCVSNNPTSTPAPSPTDRPLASPTVTPYPTTGGEICTSTQQCMQINCGPNSGCSGACSSVCLPGNDGKNHCFTTCKAEVSCNQWGNWQCLSGVSECAACSSQGYTCSVRFCTNPANSNQYQIQCGCGSGGGGGGGSNPTNTPTPTATPTPGPFAKLKNTSFYSPRALIQPIPAFPFPYDSDDDATPYFIIMTLLQKDLERRKSVGYFIVSLIW